jgi:hypothetical protein
MLPVQQWVSRAAAKKSKDRVSGDKKRFAAERHAIFLLGAEVVVYYCAKCMRDLTSSMHTSPFQPYSIYFERWVYPRHRCAFDKNMNAFTRFMRA